MYGRKWINNSIRITEDGTIYLGTYTRKKNELTLYLELSNASLMNLSLFYWDAVLLVAYTLLFYCLTSKERKENVREIKHIRGYLLFRAERTVYGLDSRGFTKWFK